VLLTFELVLNVERLHLFHISGRGDHRGSTSALESPEIIIIVMELSRPRYMFHLPCPWVSGRCHLLSWSSEWHLQNEQDTNSFSLTITHLACANFSSSYGRYPFNLPKRHQNLCTLGFRRQDRYSSQDRYSRRLDFKGHKASMFEKARRRALVKVYIFVSSRYLW
jgi:hypothetical protein